MSLLFSVNNHASGSACAIHPGAGRIVWLLLAVTVPDPHFVIGDTLAAAKRWAPAGRMGGFRWIEEPRCRHRRIADYALRNLPRAQSRGCTESCRQLGCVAPSGSKPKVEGAACLAETSANHCGRGFVGCKHHSLCL